MIDTLYHSNRSPIHAMWNDFSTDLFNFMDRISLADYVQRYREEKQVRSGMQPNKAA